MDIEQLKLLFNVLQFLLTGGIGFYVYMSNKNRVTNERMGKMEDDIDTRLDDHSSRLARVEETVRHLPMNKDIDGVRYMVASVGGDVKALTAEVTGLRELMKPMQHTIDLVNQYLLNHK